MSDRRRQAVEEEDDWLFDSIVGYLSSPIWKIPIEHFFEQNCTIFSPKDGWSGSSLDDNDDSDDEASIPAEYLEAHIKYKNLVDALINSFLQDIGVTYKQFLDCCQKSKKFTQQPVLLELFEQIWCTENINIFKSRMIKKNVELELQALVLLQYQLGLMKKSSKDKVSEDDEIMAIVIRQSKEEYNSLQGRGNAQPPSREPIAIATRSDLETAKKIVNDSDEIEKSLQYEIDQQAYLSKREVKQELKNPTGTSVAIQQRPASAAKRPVSARKNMDNDMHKLSLNDNPRASSRMQAMNEPSNIVSNMAQAYMNSGATSEAELKRRAEFMEKQRELLTEKKRVERQKQLDQYVRANGEKANQVRPMSSRAARSLLKGAESDDLPQSTLNTKSITDEERKRAEARRALAETLKKEVINQSRRN